MRDPQTFDIYGQEKDSLSVVFCHTYESETAYIPYDLRGWRLKSSILLGEDATSMPAPDNFDVSFDKQVMGLVRIELPKDHLLPAGNYWYSIRGVRQDMEEVVLLRGKLEIDGSAFA